MARMSTMKRSSGGGVDEEIAQAGRILTILFSLQRKLDIDLGHGRGRRGKYLPSGPTERTVQRSSDTTAMVSSE